MSGTIVHRSCAPSSENDFLKQLYDDLLNWVWETPHILTQFLTPISEFTDPFNTNYPKNLKFSCFIAHKFGVSDNHVQWKHFFNAYFLIYMTFWEFTQNSHFFVCYNPWILQLDQPKHFSQKKLWEPI